MDGNRFDDLTRALGSGRSRRSVFKALGAAVLGAAGLDRLGGNASAGGGNSACAHWCHDNFSGSAAGQCTSDAAHGTGACYACGPAAPAGNGLSLCGGVCVNESTDLNNCGRCGSVCNSTNGTASCSGGACGITCNPGFADCNHDVNDGCETSLTTITNCGACRNACAAPSCVNDTLTTSTCNAAGNCVSQQMSCSPLVCNPAGAACLTTCATDADCVAGEDCCGAPGGEICVDTTTDVNNCGSCGFACRVPAHGAATCLGGVCGVVCDSGYDAVHGGCFQINNEDMPELCTCNETFSPNVDGSVNRLCAYEPGYEPCSRSSDCPVGQACFNGSFCIAPCP